MKTRPQLNDLLQRSVLPIPDRRPVSLTTYDAKDPDTRFPAIAQLRPPTGAPNVLVILLDDVGFGASSAFGGPWAPEAVANSATSVAGVAHANPAVVAD